MRAAGHPFFGGRVVDTIVRNGEDVLLASAADTYRVMLLQIAKDYPGLPDARTLTVPEIVFFYDGLRPELKRAMRLKVMKGRHG